MMWMRWWWYDDDDTMMMMITSFERCKGGETKKPQYKWKTTHSTMNKTGARKSSKRLNQKTKKKEKKEHNLDKKFNIQSSRKIQNHNLLIMRCTTEQKNDAMSINNLAVMHYNPTWQSVQRQIWHQRYGYYECLEIHEQVSLQKDNNLYIFDQLGV